MAANGPDSAAPDVDVAIVGCGPTGVVLAGLLALRGLSVQVCDRLEGVYEIPRAIALDHEILRLFQQLGVVESVLQHCEPFTDSVFYGVDGQAIRRMTMLPPPYPQGYTPSMVFTQPPVERLLRERVASLPGVRMRLGLEVLGIEQDAQGVTLQHGDGSRLRAAWAVACDGGSSRLRTALGLALEDLGFDEPWLVCDVLVGASGLAKLPATSVQYCEPERPCTLVIGPGNHRRWEISLKPGEDPAEAATPEGTWRLLSRWLSPDDGQLWRQSSYRFHALVAEPWRRGRVFLAGDAAHMQPPFLGQGMCQGLRDAANLAWKMAAVQQGRVQGAAAERLLDSYGQERQAHVRALTTRLKAIGAVICERDPAAARARDARLLAEQGGSVRPTPRQDVLPRLELGLLQAAEVAGRGALFPQPRLAQGLLMDEAFGCDWRLVLGPEAGASGLRAEVPELCTIDLARTPEAEGVAADWLRRHEAQAALLRPDHYVFGTAHDGAGLQALLAEWRQALHG